MSEKLETVAWAATSEENVVEALSFNSSRSRFTTALVFRSQAESLLSERDATIAQQAARVERERTARKTAQESLEQYKGECTRLQHEVDRLNGEGAVDQSERA